MDSQPQAPPVVVVVVTCDPGPWLEDSLVAFANQDYPNLSVLIIDAGSAEDPTPRVASVMPNAFVRRLGERVGFSRAANEVLAIVEGASHFLLCHDDVAPSADAVRVMVEEAFRSNAGIVTPKFVQWDHPDRLLAVGQSVDKTGAVADLVQVGELDQEQHDSVRDVFCAPGGCLLVRADLFATLGGFDEETDLAGESLNLCWRAQVAGARVVVAPAVRVRHLEAIRQGLREGWDDPPAAARWYGLEEEHRVRTLLTCYSAFHLMRVVPQAVVLSLAQALVQLFTGRVAMAQGTLLAWPRALRRRGWFRAHVALRKMRRVSDTEVRKLQTPGFATLRAFFRSTLEGESAIDTMASTRRITSALGSRAWRSVAAAWAVVLVVLAVGSRSVIGHAVPAVGTLPALTGGPSSWWHLWWSGWRPQGLGSAAASPPGLALLALGGTVLLGGIGVLQRVLIFSPLVLGPWGAYRASRPLESPLARATVLVAYAAVPLPFNALAGGRWPGLVAYGLAPWLLGALCRLAGDAPFVAAPRRRARVVALGLLLAAVSAFVPAMLAVVPLTGVGIALGSSLAGRPIAGLRSLAASVGATIMAAVLLFPWTLDLLRSRTAVFGVAVSSAGAPRLADVLRFHTGSSGAGVLGFGLLAAAALPLLLGRSWRLVWASRMWGVAVGCWVAVWAAGRGYLPVPMAQPEVFLAPAGAALALSVGLGALAFQTDLPGYRLGWRQLASVTAAVGLLVAAFGLLQAAGGGRWNIPQGDFPTTMSLSRGSNYRVLWVGDPRALPLGSWQYQPGYAYATSTGPAPSAADLWPPASDGATPLLATDLRLASDRLTTQLGHLLAPMAVRYIVIPSRTAPAGTGGTATPVPTALLSGLDQQTDLKVIPVDDALNVYQNVAWAPARALLGTSPSGAGSATSPASAAIAATDPTASQTVDLSRSSPVLNAGGSDAYRGRVPANAQVLVGSTDQRGWHLSVGGAATARQQAFGWAMLFSAPPVGGTASLHYDTPVVARLLELLEVGLWLAAIVILVGDRRRRRSRITRRMAPTAPTDTVVRAPARDRTTPAARRPKRVTVPADDDDEMWP
ncbi:MAG: glycosyltransferase [Acidimicrobiales bacterium]